MSNGIPGVPGAPQDAVLLSAGPSLSSFPERSKWGSDWVHVAAHEVGHFLGLMHTCELEEVGVCDAIEDTPEMHPVDNSMYFNVSAAGRGFSPQQGAIMRLSPYVKPL